MISVNTPFFDWLMDMLRSIAGARTPFGDTVMSGVTVLGQEALFIVAACVLLYCVDKRAGYKFLFMFHLGQLVNQALKLIFMIPRPWMIDESFEIVESARAGATGWSFPSGHTQSAVMMYFGLSRELKKRWAYIAAAVLVLLVGFSRMYLGVHTLLDVSAAVVLGLITLVVSELIFNSFGDDPRFVTVAAGVSSALSLVYVVIVMLFDRESELYSQDLGTAATMLGLAFGFFCGTIVERRFIHFDVKAVWWAQLLKVAIGMGIMLGVRMGLKPLFALITDSPLMNAMRYFIMVFIGVAVYPISFPLFAALGKRRKAE